MRRIFCVLLAALMAAGILAGCGRTETKNPAASESPAAGASKADDGSYASKYNVDTSKVEIFQVLELSGRPPGYGLEDMDDPIGKIITEKTGVKFEFEFPVGEWTQKLALMIASGDYPDVVGNRDQSIPNLVDAGALVPLRGKIMDCPNILSYLGGEITRLTYTEEDTEFYAFGSGYLTDDTRINDYTNTSFAVQFAALKEQGWPDIKTLQEYEESVQKYYDANPTINGQPSIGITFCIADGYLWKFCICPPLVISAGWFEDGQWYVDQDTYEVKAIYRNPESKDYFRWLNHLNEIGLLDPETYTQSDADYQAKVASGRVVGLIDAGWRFDQSRQVSVQENGALRDYMAFPAMMNEGEVWKGMASHGSITNGGYTITTACKNVDKLVNFFDFMASEEGQILKRWGIEGENYTIENNQRVYDQTLLSELLDVTKMEEARKRTGIGKYDNGSFYTPRLGWKTSNGQMLYFYDPTIYYDEKTREPIYKEAFDAYNIMGFTQMFPTQGELPLLDYGYVWALPMGQTEETKVIQPTFEDTQQKYFAKLSLCKPNEFDATWDAFMKELDDINLKILEEEATMLLKKRMRMLGKLD